MKENIQSFDDWNKINESNDLSPFYYKMQKLKNFELKNPIVKGYFDNFLQDSPEKAYDEQFWTTGAFELGYELQERNPELANEDLYRIAYYAMEYFIDKIKDGTVGVGKDNMDDSYYRKEAEYVTRRLGL